MGLDIGLGHRSQVLMSRSRVVGIQFVHKHFHAVRGTTLALHSFGGCFAQSTAPERLIQAFYCSPSGQHASIPILVTSLFLY